jgi:hypothetical protein
MQEPTFGVDYTSPTRNLSKRSLKLTSFTGTITAFVVWIVLLLIYATVKNTWERDREKDKGNYPVPLTPMDKYFALNSNKHSKNPTWFAPLGLSLILAIGVIPLTNLVIDTPWPSRIGKTWLAPVVRTILGILAFLPIGYLLVMLLWPKSETLTNGEWTIYQMRHFPRK